MTVAAKRIQQVLRDLPLDDMLALHEQLVESIHQKENAEPMDPAFSGEILRRVEEIDAGGIEGIDARDALKKM